jgi:hypothetical protein
MPYDPEDPRTFVDPRVWEGHRTDKPIRGGVVVRVQVLELSDDRTTATVLAQGPGIVTRAADRFTVPATAIKPWWEDAFPPRDALADPWT